MILAECWIANRDIIRANRVFQIKGWTPAEYKFQSLPRSVTTNGRPPGGIDAKAQEEPFWE
jgi:hypothetical protein